MTTTSVINTLCDTDMATLVQALERSDLGLIRMLDGQAPTPEQVDHLLQVGPAELDAAREEMRARMLRAENAMFPPERIQMLMEKYEATPGEPLGEVAQRMTAADHEELSMLIRWMAKDEGMLDHVDGS